MPISARRTMLGIPSKAGKIPHIRFSEGTVEYKPGDEPTTEPTLIFTSHGRKELLRETARYSDGRVELNWTATGGRRMTPRYASELSRALLKSAFECAWFDHGQEVFDPKFDHIRSAVLGNPRDGFFVAMRKANPDSGRVSLTYQFVADHSDTWRMLVWADYYGVFIATDSRLTEPVIDVPEGLMNVITFTEGDLRATRVEVAEGP